MTTCLIDADVLAYSCSYVGQVKDESGNLVMKSFDSVIEHLELKLNEIQEECMATGPPILFLTGDPFLGGLINKKYGKQFTTDRCFRYESSSTNEYKGSRKTDKPLHFYNVKAYMLSQYDCVVSSGLEADDMLSIYLTHMNDGVLCSIDKDLRQVPGMHYSWSVGNRPSTQPYLVDDIGSMALSGKPQKLFATGLKSMFSQSMMGDVVDNIRGIEDVGPVAVYNLLNDCTTEEEMFYVTAREYKKHYPDNWKDLLREHIDLVYMIREVDSNDSPVKYKFPDGWEEILSEDQEVN